MSPKAFFILNTLATIAVFVFGVFFVREVLLYQAPWIVVILACLISGGIFMGLLRAAVSAYKAIPK